MLEEEMLASAVVKGTNEQVKRIFKSQLENKQNISFKVRDIEHQCVNFSTSIDAQIKSKRKNVTND